MRTRSVLAGIAGVTLALGVAVGAGAVALPGDSGPVKAVAASAQISPVAASTARQPGDTATTALSAATTAAPATTAPTTPPTTAPKAATPTTKATTPTTKPVTHTTTPAATAATTAPTTAPVVAAVTTVARRVPSAAEVQSAITALPTYVHSILTPSAAQVAQLGDQICTAFDQGQTFAQVKATGLSLVTQIPLTTILPGGADWVVRTAVNLYCPGYASKLV